jgi:hypothetical protein
MEISILDNDGSEEWKVIFEAVLALLEKDREPEAREKLTSEFPAAPTPEIEALLAAGYFNLEQYGKAAQQYRNAVLHSEDPEEVGEPRDGESPDDMKGRLQRQKEQWLLSLEACENNVAGRVNEHVPDIVRFKEEELLQAPPDPQLPEKPPIARSPYQFYKMRYIGPFVGKSVGRIGSFTFNNAVKLFGRDYRGKVWTNWYAKKSWHGILNLAFMRDKLNSRNLTTTYPAGSKIGFQNDALSQPEGVEQYRTADGSWNNLDSPKEGAAHTRFLRNVTPEVAKPDADLLEPNPRLISRKLLTRGEEMQEVPFLNMLAASWIQFQNHDWISHGENAHDRFIRVPLPRDDPAREKYLVDEIKVPATQPDPSRDAAGKEDWDVTHVNEVTHWWDGSQIYGSDLETQQYLRSGFNGRLRVETDGRLPLNELDTEATGFLRNWWVGLSMLHTLFVLEHNAICDHLKYRYPSWNDEQLFNVARLINAAVMAKIHSVEWTPAILPNPRLNTALNSNWYGLLTYLFGKPGKRKTVATFNVQNAELGGLVGNDIDKHGFPYGLTEEFVEVYRLHSLLPESLTIRNFTDDSLLEEIPFVKSRQAGSPRVTGDHGMANLFYSFGNQHPGNLGLNNYPKFMQELSVPGNAFFDMGAIDILRARERGVPRYNEFRRQLNLNPIRRFEDLTDNAEHVAAIREVYGDDVEKLDLMVGTLAESHRPRHFGFGETMFQIFILNASRRLQADRFYTTDYREEVYTREGMKWIDKATFKSVILRHYPELEETGLGNITNAFEPWDTNERLSPRRHPLRAYAPELKKDPWRGDAY